ncbi:MAG: galactose oxidase [Bacteroidetes bacterium]|nr:galactose oxidase [Bacteroidota bacterium]
MKYVVSTISLGLLFLFCLGISSCNNTTPTTTLPGSWDKIGDFNGVPRSGAVSFVIGGYAYIGGGFNYDAVGQPGTPTGRLNDFWKYDPVSDTWTQMANFPGTARSNAASFTLNGKGYVGTGFDGTNAYSDFYEFDPTVGARGKWTRIADFGYSADQQDTTVSARYGCVAFTVKNRAFVGAGHYISDLKDLWEYDPTNNVWISRGSTGGSKRQNGFVMVINDIAYVGGGTDNGQYVRDFYKFDVDQVDSGSPWTALNGLTGKDANGNPIVQPKPRELASTFSLGNFGYLVCGSLGGPLNDTWQYDPSTDTWIQYYNFSTNTPISGSARSSACAFALTSSLGTYGYLVAGGSGNLKFDDCWLFNPVGIEPDNK